MHKQIIWILPMKRKLIHTFLLASGARWSWLDFNGKKNRTLVCRPGRTKRRNGTRPGGASPGRGRIVPASRRNPGPLLERDGLERTSRRTDQDIELPARALRARARLSGGPPRRGGRVSRRSGRGFVVRRMDRA